MNTSAAWPEARTGEYTHVIAEGETFSGAQHYAAKARFINGRAPSSGVFAKWPNELSRIWSPPSYKRAVEDLRTLQSLPVPLAKTEIRNNASVSQNGSARIVPYVILQEELSGPQLTELDFQRRNVRQMFKVALEASWNMYKETGKAVDFMGGEAVGHYGKFFRDPKGTPLAVHNVRKDDRGNFVCFDPGLLDASQAPLMIQPIVKTLTEVQHFALMNVLNQYLDEDEKIYIERGRFEYLFEDNLLSLDGGSEVLRQMARVMCTAVDVRKAISRL